MNQHMGNPVHSEMKCFCFHENSYENSDKKFHRYFFIKSVGKSKLSLIFLLVFVLIYTI